jgi:hypothetical protein
MPSNPNGSSCFTSECYLTRLAEIRVPFVAMHSSHDASAGTGDVFSSIQRVLDDFVRCVSMILVPIQNISFFFQT